MKRSQLWFTAILIPVDFAMLLLAAATAYRFRLEESITDILPISFVLEFKTYFLYAIAAAVGWLVIFALIGMYNVKSNRKLSQELGKTFVGSSLGLLGITFSIFLERELFSSRFIILAAWPLAIIFVFFGRAMVLWVQRSFFRRGLGSIKIVLIGADETTEAIQQEIAANPGHGFRVVSTFNRLDEAAKKKILNLHKDLVIDDILVADPDIAKDEKLEIIRFTEKHHLGFRYAADLFNTLSTNIRIEPIAGIPIIELRRTRLEGWGRVFKRVFDIIISLILIIITSPIMLVTAIAVKLESGGPIIFKNERVGQRGELFDTLKFRSMKSEYSIGKQFEKSEEALRFEKELIEKQDSRKGGPVYKIKDDPRLTRIGGFIRRWSIDELPQFFNVFKGDMSLVGPRPHQPREVEKYEHHHQKLLAMKPGITGMAQVSGRSDLTFEEEAILDLFYIENWSPWLDLQILLKTPLAILRNRSVI